MAVPIAIPAIATAVVIGVIWRISGIATRMVGYKVVTDQIAPLFDRVTLDWILDQWVTDPKQKDMVKAMLNDPNALKPARDFVEFLKNWNKEIALKSMSLGIVAPEWGYMASRLLSALQWSYGLGWLSWVGMSPILNNLVAEPAEQALLAAFPRKKLTKSEVEKAFLTGLYDERKLRAELKAMGYTDQAIDTIIQIIHNTKLEKDRDLTKTDILRAYREGVIDAEKAKSSLVDLGYTPEEAEILLKLEEIKKQAGKKVKEKDLTTSQILQAYRYGVIPDRGTAKVLLMKIGYDEEEAELLLKIEDTKKQIQKHERGRDLSKTDILKALEQRLITPEEAVQMLVEIGYDRDEAELLVASTIVEVLGSATQA